MQQHNAYLLLKTTNINLFISTTMKGKEVTVKINTNSNPISSSSLSVHKDSHAYSKLKQQQQVVVPKIRIIHIFAPQVIKTDASNFRELVHRLTGKPDHQEKQPPYAAKPISRKILKKRRSSAAISAPKRDIAAANMTTLQHQDEISWGCGDRVSSNTSTTTAAGFRIDDFDLFCSSDHFMINTT